MYSASPKAKRIEFRCPDPSSNPYLAFSAMMMAGLDGVMNRIDPGDPLDKDIYDMDPEELKNVPSTPGSLNEAIKALADDHEYLLKGDVFTEDVVETWINYKIDKEIKPMALQPETTGSTSFRPSTHLLHMRTVLFALASPPAAISECMGALYGLFSVPDMPGDTT